MSTRRIGSLDRARPESRRSAPPPFAARAAGLYSEVVWDRNWAVPAQENRPATAAADPRPSLTE